MGGVSRVPHVLLPPSESKEPGGRHSAAPGCFDSALAAPRRRVVDALAHLLDRGSPDEISRVLKARGPLLERALESTRRLVAGTAPTLPAWQRYQGVVWTHLDPTTLNDEARRRILVPSGLYGLSSGLDELADYRLTMKVGLGEVGSLAAFWRPALTRVLEELGDLTIVNFLPKEHDGAIFETPALSSKTVRVSFTRRGGGGVAGHDAKAVKGAAARAVLEHGLDGLDNFRWHGWRSRASLEGVEIRAPGPRRT